MKNFKKLFPIAMVAIMLSGCGNGTSNSNSDTGSDITTTSGGETTEPEAKKYKIAVTAPESVHYSLSEEYQEPGKNVILSIDSVDDGFSISEISVNNKVQELGADNKLTFVMPNRSVNVIIKCSVTGNVTLQGDVIGILTDDDNDGIYVAKDVKVTGLKSRAEFSLMVGETVLKSTSLDEYRCFGDITFSTGNYAFSIGVGATYDFYYEPDAQYPFYVIRTNVDVLPCDSATLDTLFDGMMRAESTCNPAVVGLNHIDYFVKDLHDSENLIWNNFSWDLYENNTSFATVKDTMNSDRFGNPREYYVYKHADYEKGIYSVVDTYNLSYGNNDRTRDDYNNYGAYSAQFDIVDLDSDDNTRFERSKREITRALNTSSHMGYNLEREFMYAYRTGYEADEMDWHDIKIESVMEDDGFKTNINSIAQYNSEEGTYTSKRHEAIIYEVELHFTKSGSVKSIDYNQYQYKQTDWNFSTHSPMQGAQANFQKTMVIECTYGAKKVGSPNFDTTPYFIQDFTKMHFYNDDVASVVSDDGVTNYLHYNDKVRIATTDNYDKMEDVDLEFTPSTALDRWQYGPTASDNENVITRCDNDLYYQMTCIDTGSANVTFTNHTANSGVSHTEKINVVATKKYHSLYIYHYDYVDDGSSPVTSATSASIVAGTIAEFNVSCTPDNAPVIFDAVPYVKGQTPIFRNGEWTEGTIETRMKVLQTGKRLILDCEDFIDIQKAVTVIVRCSSDQWFQDYMVENNKAYQDFEMTITPASVDPTGTWLCDMASAEEKATGIEDYVKVEFLNEAYGTTEAKKGVLTNRGKDPVNNIDYEEKFYFAWTYKRGYIQAQIYQTNLDNADSYTFDISFGFLSEQSTWGVCLRYSEYDADSENWYTFVYDYIGAVDADGDVNGYLQLTKQA